LPDETEGARPTVADQLAARRADLEQGLAAVDAKLDALRLDRAATFGALQDTIWMQEHLT